MGYSRNLTCLINRAGKERLLRDLTMKNHYEITKEPTDIFIQSGGRETLRHASDTFSAAANSQLQIVVVFVVESIVVSDVGPETDASSLEEESRRWTGSPQSRFARYP